jgi:hypothetical protein
MVPEFAIVRLFWTADITSTNINPDSKVRVTTAMKTFVRFLDITLVAEVRLGRSLMSFFVVVNSFSSVSFLIIVFPLIVSLARRVSCPSCLSIFEKPSNAMCKKRAKFAKSASLVLRRCLNELVP